MSLVDLKFSPEMARAVIAGKKCCTSRRERKGWPGDEFELEGARFRILDVMALTYNQVCVHLFRCEGVPDSIALVTVIERIYGDLSPETPLFVHFFARCP